MRKRRIAACFLALTLAAAAFVLPQKERQQVCAQETEQTALVKGDVDGNNEVGAEDALLVLKNVAHMKIDGTFQNEAADVNGNGGLEAEDALGILKYVAHMVFGFPEEAAKEYTIPEVAYEKTIVVDSTKAEQEGISYRTMKAAVAYVNENPPASEENRIRILIEPGVYREHLVLTAPYVYLQGNGEKAEDVILTYYYGCSRNYHSLGKSANADSATVLIKDTAHDFVAKDVTFENSHNLYMTEEELTDYCDTTIPLDVRKENYNKRKCKIQALALNSTADRSAFYGCRFIGRQDTLLIHNYARFYFAECYIEGTTDYIYGSGVAVFDHCRLNVPQDGGALTAGAHEKECPYGYLFMNCDLTREVTEYCPEGTVVKNQDTCLGRPWNGLPQIIFWNCKMDEHINRGKDRYVNMKGDYSRVNCRLFEGKTRNAEGFLLNTRSLIPDYMFVMEEADMKAYYSAYNHLIAKYNPSSDTRETPDYWNPGSYAATEAGTPRELPAYVYK